MVDSEKFDQAVREVRSTLKAFNVCDTEGRISWSIVKDLVWSKVIE